MQREAENHADAVRLMTHPGVGPVTALAFVLTLGPVARFQRSKQVVSYLGLNPKERSSGDKQHTYSISKQGNTMMRWLLVEAGQTAVRFDPELQRVYRRLKFNKGASVAKVAIARKLAVKLYWLLRATASCAQMAPMQGSSRGTLIPQVGSSYWDRVTDWAPCLPAQAGSSNHESWSVVEDRIDGWWNQRSTAGFTMRALVGQKQRFLAGKEKMRPHKMQSPSKRRSVS